jgi:hypothetical protein
LCAKKYFGELEDIRLLAKIFHSREIYVEIIKMRYPSQNNILKGSMAQTQNKNQKNPTYEKPVPATVLPNNLDNETKTSDCTSFLGV